MPCPGMSMDEKPKMRQQGKRLWSVIEQKTLNGVSEKVPLV